MLVLKIVGLVILIFTFILFLGDFAVRQYRNLKHFHIGRWNSQKEWMTAVKTRALKWMNHTPIVSASEYSGNLIIGLLSSNRKNSAIQSWQKAGLVLGLLETNDNAVQKALTDWKKSILSSDGNWINPVSKVDFALLAYALLKSENQPATVKPAMDWVIRMLENNLCNDGMISYSKGKESNLRYVDTLGMVCPFLALYGKTFDHPEYCDIAYNQISKFREVAILPKSQLPCHVYLAKEKQPLGV